LTNYRGEDSNPDWSPDGKKIVFTSDRTGNHEIYSINANGTGLKQLTNNSLVAVYPQWSPDGSWIMYASANKRTRDFEICVMHPDGTEIMKIAAGDSSRWSPDGKNIAFIGVTSSLVDVFMAKPDGTEIKNLSNSNAFEFGLSWSSDSKHIAYVTDQENNTEIYTVCVDCDNNQPINITNSEAVDRNPSWSPDGSQIAFQSGDILCVMNADGSQKKCFNKQSTGTIDWKP
jgi:TolB protein